MAKKNGLPKDEYGAFLHEQQIGKTGTTNFSVVHVAEVNIQNKLIFFIDESI